MFRLKVSSFLRRINAVKMHIGLSPAKDDSRLEGNAAYDRDEETTSAVKEEMNSKREAVDKLYKLEMDERGLSLSFSWALNSKGKVKQRPIGAPFKRARTSNLSSSTANYEPLQHPGGAKLKFIGDSADPTRETPEPQRIDEANEEAEALNSTSRRVRARFRRNPSRPRSTGECRGMDTSKGSLRGSGGFREDDNANQANAELCDKASAGTRALHTNNMFPGRPGTENSERVLSGENFIYTTDSLFRQEVRSRQPSGAKIKPHTTFPSGAVLLCKNEPEQEPKGAQDVIPQTKRKRSGRSTRNPDSEAGDRKPVIFKAVKIEVNTQEDEDFNFPSGARCILGLRPGSRDLMLLEPLSDAMRSQHVTSASDIECRGRSSGDVDEASLNRLMHIAQKEERGEPSDILKVEFPNKVESGTGGSRADANGDRLFLLQSDSVNQTGTTKCELAIGDTCTNLEVSADCLIEGRLHCKGELTNEQRVVAPTTERVSDIHKTGPSKAYSRSEESQIALGVTEEDLVEAFIDDGTLVPVRAADLVFKFHHHLKTVEANNAFLQLLKRYCKPEEKNGELFLEFSMC